VHTHNIAVSPTIFSLLHPSEMRSNRLLTIIAIVFGAAATVVALSLDACEQQAKGWLDTIALRIQPYALEISLVLLAIAVIIQVIAAWRGPASFRRETVQSSLDHLAQQCGGKPRQNRITIFKKVSGFTALTIGLWRLKGRMWRKEKRAKLKTLLALEWFADYLMVYARSSESRQPRSTTCWRISDRAEECMGVAGLIWEEGRKAIPNLPKLHATHIAEIRKVASMEQLSQRSPNDAIRRYLDKSGNTDLTQLKTVEVFARHFFGEVIQTKDGPWGVLLLDSEADECPFAVSDDEAEGRTAFERVFATQAFALGNMLRGA
jgi:hypothetical protein